MTCCINPFLATLNKYVGQPLDMIGRTGSHSSTTFSSYKGLIQKEHYMHARLLGANLLKFQCELWKSNMVRSEFHIHIRSCFFLNSINDWGKLECLDAYGCKLYSFLGCGRIVNKLGCMILGSNPMNNPHSIQIFYIIHTILNLYLTKCRKKIQSCTLFRSITMLCGIDNIP